MTSLQEADTRTHTRARLPYTTIYTFSALQNVVYADALRRFKFYSLIHSLTYLLTYGNHTQFGMSRSGDIGLILPFILCLKIVKPRDLDVDFLPKNC